MCVAIRSNSTVLLRRLIEYFEPVRKEMVFDFFCEVPPGVPKPSLTVLHRGKVSVDVESDSLFGAPSPNALVDFVAHRAADLHREDAGWLTYVQREGSILFPTETAEGDREYLSYEPAEASLDCELLTPENRAGHHAFTMWRVTPLKPGNIAFRLHLTMTEETAKALTGSGLGEPPEFFWINGDFLLLDEVRRDLATLLEHETVFPKLLLDFEGLGRVAPRVFEFVQVVFGESTPSADYRAHLLSVNTFTESTPPDWKHGQNWNWIVLAPDSGRPFSPYGRFQVRFESQLISK
jgi:hypothetical protein